MVQLVHARRREGSRPGQRKDGFKIGLAIEVSVTFQVYGLLGRWLLIDWGLIHLRRCIWTWLGGRYARCCVSR